MGLDMYLTKKHYVGNKYRKPEEQVVVRVPKDSSSVMKPVQIKQERIQEITEEVAYWRKANAIHRWFVETVQNGVDDCGEYYVSREQLQDLYSLCNTVLASSHLVDGKIKNGERFEGGVWAPIMEDGQKVETTATAEILLPTQSGFFFGSQDYDQYYIDDLKSTVEQLDAVLKEGDQGSLYYQSSW